MSATKKLINMPAMLLGSAAFLGAVLTTHLLRNAQFPIGWNYLALFLLAGLASTFGRGIFRWVLATWCGSLLMLYIGTLRQEDYLAVPASLLALQYLPAVLTGALLGEWSRFKLSRLRGLSFSPMPYWHALIAAAVLLILLPLFTFAYASSHTLLHPGVMALLMFTPGNTPFLFPSLITAALCGYWIRSPQAAAPASDRRAALVVMLISAALIIAVLLIKTIFGIVEAT